MRLPEELLKCEPISTSDGQYIYFDSSNIDAVDEDSTFEALREQLRGGLGMTTEQTVIDALNNYCREVDSMNIDTRIESNFEEYYQQVASCAIELCDERETLGEYIDNFCALIGINYWDDVVDRSGLFDSGPDIYSAWHGDIPNSYNGVLHDGTIAEGGDQTWNLAMHPWFLPVYLGANSTYIKHATRLQASIYAIMLQFSILKNTFSEELKLAMQQADDGGIPPEEAFSDLVGNSVQGRVAEGRIRNNAAMNVRHEGKVINVFYALFYGVLKTSAETSTGHEGDDVGRAETLRYSVQDGRSFKSLYTDFKCPYYVGKNVSGASVEYAVPEDLQASIDDYDSDIRYYTKFRNAEVWDFDMDDSILYSTTHEPRKRLSVFDPDGGYFTGDALTGADYTGGLRYFDFFTNGCQPDWDTDNYNTEAHKFYYRECGRQMTLLSGDPDPVPNLINTPIDASHDSPDQIRWETDAVRQDMEDQFYEALGQARDEDADFNQRLYVHTGGPNPTTSRVGSSSVYGTTKETLLFDNIANDLEILSRGRESDSVLMVRLDAIQQFASAIESRTDSIYNLLVCILKAKEEYFENISDLTDELEDALDELGSDLGWEHSTTDAEGRGWAESWVNALGQGIADGITFNIEDLEGRYDEYYVRNPAKLFYKEQCYLLTYIKSISYQKYFNYDALKEETTVQTASGELVSRRLNPAARAAFAALEIDISEDTRSRTYKRLPYNNSLLSAREFQWDGNATILLDGDPYAFLNKLAISKNLGPLYNIKSDVLSNLQPYVRLFKVIYDENGVEHDVEITFEPAHTDYEKNLYSSKKLRNTGVGLKNFTFTYDGSNPFGAKKSIKANMKIFATTFDELMETRVSPSRTSGGTNYRYKYVDLAIKTFNTGETRFKNLITQNVELAKLNFRLKAQVGYSVPRNFSRTMSETDLNELRNALYDSVVTLNLTPTVHDFDFDETGRVIFSINYLAYVEDLFSEAKFNVFSEPTFAKNRILRQLSLEYYAKECEYEAQQEIKNSYAQIAAQEVADSLSHLMSTLIDRDKIYYLPVSSEEVRNFISHGPWATYNHMEMPTQPLTSTDYLNSLEAGIEETLEAYTQQVTLESRASGDTPSRNLVSTSLAVMDPNDTTLAFFYVSDLIDCIIELIETELRQMPDELRTHVPTPGNIIDPTDIEEKAKSYEKYLATFRKMRWILGPVEFAGPDLDPRYNHNNLFVNLGDIPISVKYFMEWITSTMLDKDDSYYALSNFMNDFFSDLVSKFLNSDRCFDYSVQQRTRFYQSTLLGAADTTSEANFSGGYLDPITSMALSQGNIRPNVETGPVSRLLPLTKTSGPAERSAVNTISSEQEINYMVYFVGRTMPTEEMRGNKIRDEQKGIFHYQIGLDRGLVKDIKLTKTQTPGLQEVRFEQEGYDGLEQLRVVYDAKIDCYSNINTFPGTYIYIEPRGYSPMSEIDLTKYGIGGYYMIVRSTHQFGPGIANSEIDAKWVNKKYDEEDRVAEVFIRETSGTEDTGNSKCSRHVERAEAAVGADDGNR
jgi:hypothetical protein